MELIKDEYTTKDLVEMVIIFSAGIFLSYVVTNSFLTDDHKLTRKLGFILYISYFPLFALLFKSILNFSYLVAQRIYKKTKWTNLKDKFILAYWPFIFAFVTSIYLFVKSKNLYNLALKGEIDFYQSELINIKAVPSILVITFIIILISKIYILYKSKKISLIRSTVLSTITSLTSFISFFIAIGAFKILAYIFLAVINLAGGAPFGP